MTLAVGRLLDDATGEELGTVFAVTSRWAITAFHCIGNRSSDTISIRRVRCVWQLNTSIAMVQDGDASMDVALLRLHRVLPSQLEPLPITSETTEHTPFVAPGAPAEISGLFSYAVSGEVTWRNAQLTDGTPVIQLACREAAAGLPLHGLSGAPVLVGRPLTAVGVVRWNPPRRDLPNLAAGASFFAAPISEILHRWPHIHPVNVAKKDPKLLAKNLLEHTRTQNVVDIAATIRQLLTSSAIGLDQADLEASQPGSIKDSTRIDIPVHNVSIFVREDLSTESPRITAERSTEKYLTNHPARNNQRHIAILTDGTRWQLHHRISSNPSSAEETRINFDLSRADAEDLSIWLESILSSRRNIKPTPREIENRLGARSPSYSLDAAELSSIYAQCRTSTAVKVKRDMWAKLLTTASGVNFEDDDSLFVDHSLLVAMAEVVGHAVVGFHPEDPSISAKMIMSGRQFARSQIGGVVESDFFDWIVETPAGEHFIKNLAQRLTRFAWDQVEHDVMKVLYQSIIPEEVRHRLGEYYTPDWLAEEIINECVTDPLEQRVLDASCGSGTFLFHAVRAFISAAEAEKWPDVKVVQRVGEQVIGIDVHPVAVALARVTYLLAIGVKRLQASDRPAFSVPVYLGDSLRWGQESTLWSYEGLCVGTVLEHSAFIHDSELSSAPQVYEQLKFPERVVANAGKFDGLVTEFADKATRRPRHSQIPPLSATFERFAIDAVDRPALEETFSIMCKLHDEERNHIWGYYVRNLARPVWLALPKNRVDVLVGNPPWLAYRYMTEPQKLSFYAMNAERRLWVGGSVATNQDLSALFVARCIELYLRPGGRFGYVMPLGTLTRRQYAGFRTGNYSGPAETVKIAFARPWDLHQVKPKFFPQSVGAVFGIRQDHNDSAVPLDQAPEVWSGKFQTSRASRSETESKVSRIISEPRAQGLSIPSKYAARFFQGATVVPRMLFIVDPVDGGPLGTGANRQAVRSRRSPLEKKPWKDLPPLQGIVERSFLHPIYLGDSILPYRPLDPLQAVIPWDGERLLQAGDDELDRHPALSDWWRMAEAIWDKNRSSARLTLKERLDYRRGMSQQLPAPPFRVVYSASGMYLAAAIISDPSAVIEHRLYWGAVQSIDEARFLTGILNSSTLTLAVRPLQARGESNPRHFDKYVFELPIPLYNPENEAHRMLSTLSERAERVASTVLLPNVRFEALRRLVRDALTEDGVGAEIDAVVKKILN
ncbi:N-6 DNA methylase [Streptomyces venezuelae]|uniref:N-6 DNA methylase n=1 Tax=Streptomyces venezuelae TaxID=54571 RepID=UPI00379443AE